jgi:protein FRG1
MPVKPLVFKGDKRPKKRKHRPDEPSESKKDPNTHPTDSTAQSEDDVSWTTPDAPTDLAGPVILILPTSPATCLAADAHGNVFASPIENMIEESPETGEPHDVRQVWVANAVVGMGKISLKAAHGGYLSCDALGVLGAKREARGQEEGFIVEEVTNGEGRARWRVKTAMSKDSTETPKEGAKYISALSDASSKEGERKTTLEVSLRGDGDAGESSTELIIKMQARFKPRVQENKETKAKEKISRQELEQVVGRRLDDDEIKRLKKARKNGTYYEEVLDVRVKGKHDKFA